MTVRINQRNSKIALTNNIMKTLTSETAQKSWIELMNMQWDDYDDFEKKYGSDVNPDNYAKRMSVWQSYNLLGHLLEKNVVDADTCYIAGGTFSIYVWQKYKQILDEHSKRYVGSDAYTGLEYLAEEMLKLRIKNDSSFEVPDTFTKYLPDQ
jgi:hypothetical protein